MLTKFQFVLRCYKNGGGDHNDDSDIPRWYIAELTPEQASYYLKRMALVVEVQKVDDMLRSMEYRDRPGRWWYRINNDEDGPDPGEEPCGMEHNSVDIREDAICWTGYHEGSSYEMVTEDVPFRELSRLSQGMRPYDEDEEEHQHEEVPSFSPMQVLMQAAQQQPLPHLPPLPAVPAEVTFDTNEGGDEGGEPDDSEGESENENESNETPDDGPP